MKKRNQIKMYKEKIIDGIDVSNIWTHSSEEILSAEAKNHAPEIQYEIGNFIEIVFEKEFDALEKKLEKEYGENSEKKSTIYQEIKATKSLKWYCKAADQNYVPAMFELYCFYIDELFLDKEKAYKYFKLALEKLYVPAVEHYLAEKPHGRLPDYLANLFDSNELVEAVCKKYNCIWNEDYRKFDITKTSNVSLLNAHLYKMMFCAYDKVRELKNQIDSFIKQGKKYYKNYEIECRIHYFP